MSDTVCYSSTVALHHTLLLISYYISMGSACHNCTEKHRMQFTNESALFYAKSKCTEAYSAATSLRFFIHSSMSLFFFFFFGIMQSPV